MPTYAQLEQEPVWRAQFAPAALTRLAQRLSAASGAPVWIGGDNTHLNGRHRSRDWCLTSKWCTNRSYATVDGRDKRGDGRWYRALDWAIKGRPLWDACRRLDAAVRAGRLPGVAEWFGTYDGKTVVGWYEGRPSSSDTSHLTHLHVGVWTEVANDDTVMAQIYAVLTGTEEDDVDPTERGWLEDIAWTVGALRDGVSPLPESPIKPPRLNTIWAVEKIRDLDQRVSKLSSPPAPDKAALKAVLLEVLADPQVKAVLAQATFEGAQRAERE